MKALEKAKEEINEEKNETEKSGSTSPEICNAPEKKDGAAENESHPVSVFQFATYYRRENKLSTKNI